VPIDATYEPSGRTFIPTVLGDQKFRSKGFLTGVSSARYFYVVIDPRRHPLYVWKKLGHEDDSYQKTARSLGAAAFSNGPMMDGFSPRQIAESLLKEFGYWGLIAAFGGALLGAVICVLTGGAACVLWAVLMGIAFGVSGGMLGVGLRLINILEGGIPFNVVVGTKHGINDPGNHINGNLVWFGRHTNVDFSSYVVGGGPPPNDLVEMNAGLIPLVRNFAALSNVPGASTYNQAYASLENAAGVVAWALIPLGTTPTIPPATAPSDAAVAGGLTPADLTGVNLVMPGDTTPLDGVLFVIGKGGTTLNPVVAGILQSIGARDAVAMDGSDSVMLGSGGESYVGTPVPFYKQHIQRYGFYCQ
jgi:hypothetical protein